MNDSEASGIATTSLESRECIVRCTFGLLAVLRARFWHLSTALIIFVHGGVGVRGRDHGGETECTALDGCMGVGRVTGLTSEIA